MFAHQQLIQAKDKQIACLTNETIRLKATLIQKTLFFEESSKQMQQSNLDLKQLLQADQASWQQQMRQHSQEKQQFSA